METMKQAIMAMLAENSTPLSGEEISRRLGVSRVAVWKQIGRLRTCGIDIESTTKGYRLRSLPDTPFPWRFGRRAGQIEYHPELASTMDRAGELARAGCPPFTVVVADRQFQGRGRLARHWQSADGGLYCSLVLRPPLSPREAPLVTFAVALVLVETLAACCAVEARVKWPNDVLVGEAKIAGILAQVEFEADQVRFINLGVGLNLNNRPEVADKPAVSVCQLTGRAVDRSAVLAFFLDRLEERLARFAAAEVVADWKANTLTLGRQVTINTARGNCTGLAVDLDEAGGLILELPDGRRQTIFYGDCLHAPLTGSDQ